LKDDPYKTKIRLNIIFYLNNYILYTIRAYKYAILQKNTYKYALFFLQNEIHLKYTSISTIIITMKVHAYELFIAFTDYFFKIFYLGVYPGKKRG